MDTPTKQRLVGAAVLVALAVIFLPMLVKGPASDSGVSDVPLEVPAEPADGIETRDLPLVAPQAGVDGALGGDPVSTDRLPTVDTADAAAAALPAGTAAGEFAVHFGTYATTRDADTIVGQLRAARLPGYREQTTLNGRPAWRVRVGPYAARADAESGRLAANEVRSDVGARVVVLDADGGMPVATASTTPTQSAAPQASVSQPVAKPAAPTITTEALPPPKPSPTSPPVPVTAVAKPEAQKPAPAPAAPPAAADTGFAVQVGAFGNAAEATRLRDRLRAAGFTSFTETVNSDKGALTRVRVGPVLTRADADRLRAQVGAKAGVSGIVRPHP